MYGSPSFNEPSREIYLLVFSQAAAGRTGVVGASCRNALPSCDEYYSHDNSFSRQVMISIDATSDTARKKKKLI